MARQHYNILIIKGIQCLKGFERNAYVLMPSQQHAHHIVELSDRFVSVIQLT